MDRRKRKDTQKDYKRNMVSNIKTEKEPKST